MVRARALVGAEQPVPDAALWIPWPCLSYTSGHSLPWHTTVTLTSAWEEAISPAGPAWPGERRGGKREEEWAVTCSLWGWGVWSIL